VFTEGRFHAYFAQPAMSALEISGMRRLGYAVLVCMSAWKPRDSECVSIACSSYSTDDFAALPALSNHVASTRAYFAACEATGSFWLAVQLCHGKTLAFFGRCARRVWEFVLATQCECFEHCPVLEKVGTELAACSR
jgi:hypothetical protein